MIRLKLEVDLVSRTHGGLDVQGTNVLPVLLEQRNQEVDRERGITDDFFLGHGDVGNSGRQAENLLHLELNSGAGLEDLVGDVISGVHQSRELTSTVRGRSQQTRDLLDNGSRGQESTVLLEQLSDLLLVLVELLHVINVLHKRK